MDRTRRGIQLLLFVAVLGWIGGSVWLMEPRCPPSPVAYLPGFVEQVSPPPEAEISFRCYTQKILHARMTFMGGGQIPDGGIAVNVSTADFAARETPGPYVEVVRSFNDRVTLYLDGRKLLKGIYYDSLVGVLIGTHPGDMAPLSSDYTFASFPILFPGDHNARIVIVPASGESLEYEWHFRITWK